MVQGKGQLIDPNHIQVELAAGGQQTIRFKKAIIAAGSEAVKLPFLPDDPRVVTSTGALELRQAPKRMLIVGGGIIGLEMGTVYSSTFGTRLDVVEMLDGLMQGADRDLVKVWQKFSSLSSLIFDLISMIALIKFSAFSWIYLVGILIISHSFPSRCLI